MRKLSLALLGAVAIGSTSAALAADLRAPVQKAPPAPVVAIYNWTGFYIGAHVGGAWGTKDWSDPDDPDFPLGGHDVSGVIAGGQIGLNWQAPGSNWVLGIEGQLSWSDAKGKHRFDPSNELSTEVEWLGTVTGRLGYALDRMLVYAKGGAAFAHDKHRLTATFDPSLFFTDDTTRTGWTVGGGVEVALRGNWSAKGEYNYMDFGRKSVTLEGGPVDVDQQIHVAKFGINYRFGGPVVARY